MSLDPRQLNAHRQRVFASRDLIAFVCESGDPGCSRSVLLSAAEYEQARAGGSGLVLHSSHPPSPDPLTAA